VLRDVDADVNADDMLSLTTELGLLDTGFSEESPGNRSSFVARDGAGTRAC